jgi:DNA-3-methyladenine glycosylase
MFKPAGTIYVYFIYGKYYCFNIVAGIPGEAVLIRSVEINGSKFLINGPGRVCRELEITLDQNGGSVLSDVIYLKNKIKQEEIFVTPRIGIKKDQERLLRFHLKKTFSRKK